MIALLLTRWRAGLSIFAALAFVGLALAANHYRHAYHTERTLRATDRASYTTAQDYAARIAQEALRHQEAVYQGKAHEADRQYALAVAGAKYDADRYVSTHRVRAESVDRASSGTIASAEDHGAGVRASVPADGVVVSESDVQACTGATEYAVKLRAWALDLSSNP